ncbi:hypothetical protein [Pseudomonas abietaniphila]|uniref:hypothetical protein n=1 Tax=Pseudomonas abietaniphila TaxID=89065 RepID=UPI0009443032|nr:hypothetical protein [Pseudomonas abietaniphila]
MSPDTLGIISGVIGIPMILITICLIYVVNVYTEKSERLMPKSSFVKANIDNYSQAGIIGKVIRNGLLTMVLMIPDISHKRGVVNLAEVRDFPTGLKRILFVTWGMCALCFGALILVGGYIKYVNSL